MWQVLAIGLGLLAPFLFPYWLTFFILALASVVVPPVGLAGGIILDALYYVPGSQIIPYASLIGLAISLIGLFVHRFIKTRIMGA